MRIITIAAFLLFSTVDLVAQCEGICCLCPSWPGCDSCTDCLAEIEPEVDIIICRGPNSSTVLSSDGVTTSQIATTGGMAYVEDFDDLFQILDCDGNVYLQGGTFALGTGFDFNDAANQCMQWDYWVCFDGVTNTYQDVAQSEVQLDCDGADDCPFNAAGLMEVILSPELDFGDYPNELFCMTGNDLNGSLSYLDVINDDIEADIASWGGIITPVGGNVEWSSDDDACTYSWASLFDVSVTVVGGAIQDDEVTPLTGTLPNSGLDYVDSDGDVAPCGSGDGNDGVIEFSIEFDYDPFIQGGPPIPNNTWSCPWNTSDWITTLMLEPELGTVPDITIPCAQDGNHTEINFFDMDNICDGEFLEWSISGSGGSPNINIGNVVNGSGDLIVLQTSLSGTWTYTVTPRLEYTNADGDDYVCNGDPMVFDLTIEECCDPIVSYGGTTINLDENLPISCRYEPGVNFVYADCDCCDFNISRTVTVDLYHENGSLAGSTTSSSGLFNSSDCIDGSVNIGVTFGSVGPAFEVCDFDIDEVITFDSHIDITDNGDCGISGESAVGSLDYTVTQQDWIDCDCCASCNPIIQGVFAPACGESPVYQLFPGTCSLDLIDSYSWTLVLVGTGVVGSGTGSTFSYTFNTNGSYQITLDITDVCGTVRSHTPSDIIVDDC